MARVADLRPSRNTVTNPSPSRDKLEIVAATAHDRPAIADLLKQVWLDTYVDPARGIYLQDIEAHIAKWQTPGQVPIPERLQTSNELRLVAKVAGEVVGYCHVRQNKHQGRLQVLHVLPGYQSRGIGAALMDAGLNWLDGSLPIHLKVVMYNERAIEFYKKFGFRVSRKFAVRLRSGKLLPKYEMIKDANA